MSSCLPNSEMELNGDKPSRFMYNNLKLVINGGLIPPTTKANAT